MTEQPKTANQPKQEVVINGHKVFFGDWPTEKSVSILTWMARSFGGAIGAFVAVGAATEGKADKEDELSESIERVLAPAIDGIFTKLDDADVNYRLQQIVADSDLLVDGQQVVYNQFYSKKLGLLMKVLKAQLEYQYSDFLGELLSLANVRGGLNALAQR